MRVAAIQMLSSSEVSENFQRLEGLLEQAVESDASLVVLPETFACFSSSQQQQLACDELDAENDFSLREVLASLAMRFKLFLIAGTIPLLADAESKPYASSLVFSPQGQCLGQYNKIHLFDADVEDNNSRYRESDTFLAGAASEENCRPIALPETPIKLGLSVCYDIRFPELQRWQTDQGANLLAVPAAFTKVTGEAHWQLLLRARAVENQCFVIGANQGGDHGQGRETSGGSCIIDPWGEVLAEMDKGEGVITAELDFQRLVEVRRNMPVLKHRRINF